MFPSSEEFCDKFSSEWQEGAAAYFGDRTRRKSHQGYFFHIWYELLDVPNSQDVAVQSENPLFPTETSGNSQ